MGSITGENPWRTLRARHHITLHWRLLPPGLRGTWTPGTITLDPRLSRIERRCTLMHELVHDERRVAWPAATRATMEREEAIVRAEAAVRLVPLDQLAAWVLRRVEVEPVTARCVAEAADVTEEVARLALGALR